MISTMKQVGGRCRLRTRTKTARGSAGAAQSLRLGLRRPTSLYIPKGTSFASQMEARTQSLLGAVFSGLLWATLWRPLSRPQADSSPKRGAKTSLLPNGNTPTLETPQALTRHCLATARSRRGSDMPPACHSLPRRRFAALKGAALRGKDSALAPLLGALSRKRLRGRQGGGNANR